ncbi:hypothetical protein ACW9KT_11965 [Hymenobacter sp. HD11105]
MPPSAAAAATAPTDATGPQPWPTELAQQMQAVRDAVQQSPQPLTATQVAPASAAPNPKKCNPCRILSPPYHYSAAPKKAPTPPERQLPSSDDSAH